MISRSTLRLRQSILIESEDLHTTRLKLIDLRFQLRVRRTFPLTLLSATPLFDGHLPKASFEVNDHESGGRPYPCVSLPYRRARCPRAG